MSGEAVDNLTTAILFTTIASTRVDNYILGNLLRDLVGRDKWPSAYAVYLFLWWKSAGSRKRSVRISHRGIADETGLSKSGVQAAIRHLNRRKLLRSRLATPTSTPEHFVLRPWLRR